MRKFVIGYLNYFDNKLHLVPVEAKDAVSALVDYFGSNGEINKEMSIEEIEEAAYSCNVSVSIIEIH